MPEKNLNFVTEGSEILNLLQRSKDGGTCIAIKALRLGTDIVVTAVEELLKEGDRHKVILKHYDTSGYILATNKLYLHEIEAVCPFSTLFPNPIKDQVEKDRPWYF